MAAIISFRRLPRPQFAALQSGIFPVYFSLQSALPVLLALTYPGSPSAGPSGLAGVLAAENRVSTLVPLATTFVAGMLNLTVLLPMTRKIMEQRKKQGLFLFKLVEGTRLRQVTESVDGKKWTDAPPHSAEMTRLNRTFGKIHGASSVVNLTAIAATAVYGFTLADRLS